MDENLEAKSKLREKIQSQKLVPDPRNPGEFLKMEVDINKNGDLGFLSPENWVFHEEIVKQVLAGNYDLIRPYSAEFVPTLNCTNRCCGPCSYCLQRMNEGINVRNDFRNPRVHMQNSGFAKSLIDKLLEGGVKGIIFTGGGEPSLFRGLEETMEYARNLGIDSVLYTNGNCLSEARIKKIVETSPKLIRLSLNCGTKIIYNKFHNPFNKENAFFNTLKSIEAFAREALDNPEVVFGIGVIMNSINYPDIPETAKRLREIVDKIQGGINFVSYRPAFNYNGSVQTQKDIVEKAYELVEKDAREILKDSGIRVSNVKCRYDALNGEERKYNVCRSTGLYAEVGPSGELHSCCDRNCFKVFAIGDLTKHKLEEIYASMQRKHVLAYANDYDCSTCPIACKPHESNKQFEKIEELRAKGELYKVELWIDAYQSSRFRPKMVNF